MTASAAIAIGQQEDVLLVPNRAIRTENGKHVVYVPAPQIGLRPVTVQVGNSDETNTVITTGLKEGELVITDPPTAAQTTNQGFGVRGIFGGAPAGERPNGGQTGNGGQPGGNGQPGGVRP